MAAAGAAGVLALGLAPGVLGGLAAVTTLLLAVLFLLLTATSGLPQPGRVLAVGRPAPEFAGLDADGHEFRLSERRGSRVLLKFFRGGW
jgi:AhpC/TSA family